MQTMREAKHDYLQIFECLGGAVFLADENSGEIIDTNRRTETCWVARASRSWGANNSISCHHWTKERTSRNPLNRS